MSTNIGWIGIDLDGTLAVYDGWKGADHIGDPVPAMLLRVRRWLVAGKEVRIVTARVGPQKDVNDTIRQREIIDAWCLKHLGVTLPITASKDYAMECLYDDRCIQVETNTGKLIGVKEKE